MKNQKKPESLYLNIDGQYIDYIDLFMNPNKEFKNDTTNSNSQIKV